MPADAAAHIRIARPSRDLDAAVRFWSDGLGLELLYTHDPAVDEHEHALRMLGWPGAGWHLELTRDPRRPAEPTPRPEDLLVVYLDEPASRELTGRLEANGGARRSNANPYWDRWGVTIEDPDGYLLVLCERGWANG